jgi:Sec-independent protein secretion pathway component TatC
LLTIIPLGFDSFDSYGDETLENFWSLEEIISVEIFVLFVVITLSQIPVLTVLNLTTETNALNVPTYWKSISLSIFVGAGIITPTIDGYTQLSFSSSAFSLYILVISILKKRANTKAFESTSAGS